MEQPIKKGPILALIVLMIAALGLWWFMGPEGQETPSPTPTSTTEVLSTYASSTLGFSLQYPEGYIVNDSYKYDNLGPEEPKISGVKFTIPASVATGTNLSSYDTGVSVEWMSGLPQCTAYPFLIQPGKVSTTTINGVSYFVASTTDAGAGNRYEETVYALQGSNPCIAVRYFIHYGVIENYPAGMVKEFDRKALLQQFDKIRQSLVVGR